MKRSFLFILLTMGAFSLRAQITLGPSTLNSSGGSHVHELEEYEWSIGEMALVNTFTGTGISVTQGVLQPNDIFITAVGNTPLSGDNLKIFPNPATSDVNVQYTSQSNGNLSYKLMDIGGKTIKSRTLEVVNGTNLEQINVANLAAATYMLEVTINKGDTAPEKTSYKIEKLK